jgi:hypothetical protein
MGETAAEVVLSSLEAKMPTRRAQRYILTPIGSISVPCALDGAYTFVYSYYTPSAGLREEVDARGSKARASCRLARLHTILHS